jgi:hypothetical protein
MLKLFLQKKDRDSSSVKLNGTKMNRAYVTEGYRQQLPYCGATCRGLVHADWHNFTAQGYCAMYLSQLIPNKTKSEICLLNCQRQVRGT